MAYLTQLREIYPQITELGAEAVAIASKPAVLAQTVLDSRHPFPLLMDPEYTFRTEAKFERAGIGMLLKKEGLANYVKALREWRLYKLEVSDATNRPITVILDAEQNIAWSHIGETLGDYPATTTVLNELRKLKGHE